MRTIILPPVEEDPSFSNGTHSNGAHSGRALEEAPQEELREEALKQMEHEQALKLKTAAEVAVAAALEKPRRRYIRKILELSKSRKTTRILLEIWQSDYSIIAFIFVVASFYVMKDTGSAPVGYCFFLLAMATVDSILSIFVIRLSFHQNKHGFYRTEDFERDWLRYRILLSMTKTALLFVVFMSCGTACVVASYVAWFFTATQRLRYIILRWSMDDHYPELQRWSVFTLLHEAGLQPRRRNFTLVAAIGMLIGFFIVFLF